MSTAEQTTERNHSLPKPTPPTLSQYGTLRWEVTLVDSKIIGPGHINVEEATGELSLTGIPWTLTPGDAQIVARALANAGVWMEAQR